MNTRAFLGTSWRLGALFVLATVGLFCTGASTETSTPTDPRLGTAELVTPRDAAAGVPVGQHITVRCYFHVTSIEADCVDVRRVGATDPHPCDAAELQSGSTAKGYDIVVYHDADPFEEGTLYKIRLRMHKLTIAEGEPHPDADPEWYFETAEPTTADPPEFDIPTTIPNLDGWTNTVSIDGDGDGDGMMICWNEELSPTTPDFWQHIYAVAISECEAGTPVLLLFDAGDRGRPVVAMNQGGMAIAAGPFEDPGTGNHGVWIRHYDPSTAAWSERVTAPAPTHAEAVRDVQIGIDNSGSGVVGYLAPGTATHPNWHFEYAEYTSSTGTWSAVMARTTPTDLAGLRLAMNPSGDAVAAAVEDVPDGGVRAYCTGGGDFDFVMPAGATASQLGLDVDEDGEAFLIWRELNTAGDAARIRVARSTICGATSAEYVDDGLVRLRSYPALHTHSRGRASATWSSQESLSSYDLKVVHYTTAAGWDAIPRVAMNSTYRIEGTHVRFSPSGQLSVLAWSSAVGEVVTEIAPGTWTAPTDVTSVPNPISIQLVNEAEPEYVDDTEIVVGFVTNIGGIQDCGVTLCD